MSISSRDDLNNYYQYFNNLVDEFTDKWRIRPSNLKRYLQPGSERFNRFLERSKSDVRKKWGLEMNDGYGRLVLQNVLEDRFHMERDGVLTFESYKLLESDEFKIKSMKDSLYKGIDKSTQKMEKILADYFDTNLSDIDVYDVPEKHKFKLKEWDDESISVILYSEEDMDIIKDNITEHLLDELENKEIELTSDIKIKIIEVIDKSSFEKNIKLKLNDNLLIKIIEDLTEHKYKDSFEGHYIWVK